MGDFIRRSVGVACIAVACVAVGLFAAAPQAQIDFDPEGDPIYEYQGPAFFGFVKDTNGASVPDASVRLAAKGRDPLIVRTNSSGAYRASFGKDVDANDVVVSCGKQGFRQVRVLRRTSRDASRQAPIEIECTLAAETGP